MRSRSLRGAGFDRRARARGLATTHHGWTRCARRRRRAQHLRWPRALVPIRWLRREQVTNDLTRDGHPRGGARARRQSEGREGRLRAMPPIATPPTPIRDLTDSQLLARVAAMAGRDREVSSRIVYSAARDRHRRRARVVGRSRAAISSSGSFACASRSRASRGTARARCRARPSRAWTGGVDDQDLSDDDSSRAREDALALMTPRAFDDGEHAFVLEPGVAAAIDSTAARATALREHRRLVRPALVDRRRSERGDAYGGYQFDDRGEPARAVTLVDHGKSSCRARFGRRGPATSACSIAQPSHLRVAPGTATQNRSARRGLHARGRARRERRSDERSLVIVAVARARELAKAGRPAACSPTSSSSATSAQVARLDRRGARSRRSRSAFATRSTASRAGARSRRRGCAACASCARAGGPRDRSPQAAARTRRRGVADWTLVEREQEVAISTGERAPHRAAHEVAAHGAPRCTARPRQRARHDRFASTAMHRRDRRSGCRARRVVDRSRVGVAAARRTRARDSIVRRRRCFEIARPADSSRRRGDRDGAHHCASRSTSRARRACGREWTATLIARCADRQAAQPRDRARSAQLRISTDRARGSRRSTLDRGAPVSRPCSLVLAQRRDAARWARRVGRVRRASRCGRRAARPHALPRARADRARRRARRRAADDRERRLARLRRSARRRSATKATRCAGSRSSSAASPRASACRRAKLRCASAIRTAACATSTSSSAPGRRPFDGQRAA